MEQLLLGLSIGFSAGVSPGPLLTLVITTTLQRGFAAGVRVACSPLITDGPIILISVLLVSALPDTVVTGLSVVGGLFVIWLGIQTWRSAATSTIATGAQAGAAHQDLLKGALVNILSPHPWLFWVLVGGTIVSEAWQESRVSAFAFLLGFYLLLIGSKVAIAGLAAAGRSRLSPTVYRRLLYAAAILLIVDGFVLAGSELF